MNRPAQCRAVSPLVAAIAAISLFGPLPAQAFEFQFADGEVTGSLDTTMSYGALWRVTAPDDENVALASGGSKSSGNFDNGNKNYDRGELVSSLFKVSHDVDLNYRNFGAFARVLYFYDHAIQNKDFDPLRADERTVRNRLGHDYEIYDAYLRGSFKVGDRNLNARIGKQVVSWGESTFLPNGINTINPVDVAKLRAPGAELKEAFLPVNMLWLSQELSDNLTVEAFSQFEHKKTRLEPNGTFFSTNDFASPGGNRVLRGSGTRDEANADATGQFITRTEDREPSGSGQFGLAARLLTPELNNSEFGFYFINYHSRTPIAGGTTGSLATTPPMGTPFVPGTPIPRALVPGVSDATYYNEYPEDIRLWGLSFSTLGPFGVALQGEYSYRPNQPLQIAATDLLAELLLNGCANTNTGIGPDNCTFTGGAAAPIPAGTSTAGFKRVKFHQFQMTATQTFGPRLGASQVVGVGEIGYTYMDLPDGVPFNGPGVDFGSGPTGRPGALSAAAANGTSALSGGTATRNSYGYRAVVRADYNNAIGPVNLSPRIAVAHDLRGTSPTFNQGVKAVSLGVNASYQQNWQADISYTNFFGGETYRGTASGAANSTTPGANQPVRSTNNALSDRDFIAATVSYSF